MCIRDSLSTKHVTSSDGNAIDLTKSQTSGSTATYDFPLAITSCPKPEKIIDPAIKEFLIIDLLEPVLFIKSLLKTDIKNNLIPKNDNHFHYLWQVKVSNVMKIIRNLYYW